MDPLSIATAVGGTSKAALALSTTLYAFVEATKNIDQSVKSLYDEVNSLTRTLDAIGGSIASPSLAVGDEASQNPELWQSVEGSLADCRNTIEKLNASLSGIKNSGSNVASQMLRTFKLNFKEDELRKLKAEIQTHNTALQLALQMINVRVSSAAPGMVINDLGLKIELLVDMIAQLNIRQPRLEDQGPVQSPTKVPPNLEHLVVSAQQVVLRANSVLSQSEQGSVYGGGLNRETRSRIQDWIARPLREPTDLFSNSNASHTQMTPSASTYAESEITQVEDQDSSDAEEEFEIEVIETSILKADERYKRGEYSLAEPFYRRAYTAAKLLSLRAQRTLDLKGIQLNIAICNFRLSKLEEVESMVNELKKTDAATKDDKIRILHATHLLAEVYCAKKAFDEANTHCRKALTGRRKLLGKQDTSCYESLGLLSVIAEGQGDAISATIYRDMIPGEVGDTLTKERKKREIPAEIENNTARRVKASGDAAPKVVSKTKTSPTDSDYGFTRPRRHLYDFEIL